MKVSILLATLSLALAEPPVPSSQYLPAQQPQNQYLPPGNQYLPPQATSAPMYLPPSNTYGVPASMASKPKPSRQYGVPSAKYGVPSTSYGVPSTQYGVPGGAPYAERQEPVSYEFEYKVQDEESGNDFGHQEKREGDVAQGRYYVLLPDGRQQVVEYTADQDGYKPKITYQQVGGYQYNRGYQY